MQHHSSDYCVVPFRSPLPSFQHANASFFSGRLSQMSACNSAKWAVVLLSPLGNARYLLGSREGRSVRLPSPFVAAPHASQLGLEVPGCGLTTQHTSLSGAAGGPMWADLPVLCLLATSCPIQPWVLGAHVGGPACSHSGVWPIVEGYTGQ